ncbi:MAG: N-acetyl-L,L-diaminopimelate aminotransferase [Bacillales bacterium]|jgi:aminotransferase|nr:N-acetyl-L,L-diaminopimelate aminotransferase [Bacillales bacterium]
MKNMLNPLVKDIEISGIRQFYNLISDIEDVISFTLGQPDFETPEHIRKAAISAIEQGKTSYTHNAGMLNLREAACEFYRRKYELNFDAEKEIIVTTGASEAIDIALRTILVPGDEVILPGPVYPGYEPIIHMCGALPIYVNTQESGFKMTAGQISKVVSAKTKCVILPYPSNPTGVTLTEIELQEIAAVLKDKNIFVLADEIYSELVFNEKHFSIARVLRDQTIVINGLSKSHAMTGWRIGFLMAPARICQEILKVHQYNVTCASSISQYAALEALTNGFDDAMNMREEYLERRSFVAKRLGEIGLDFILPDGAFYFFVKIPEGFANSLSFCLKLVEVSKVAVVPGSAFSHFGEGFFRLSYACSMENIEIGLQRMEDFLNMKKNSH